MAWVLRLYDGSDELVVELPLTERQASNIHSKPSKLASNPIGEELDMFLDWDKEEDSGYELYVDIAFGPGGILGDGRCICGGPDDGTCACSKEPIPDDTWAQAVAEVDGEYGNTLDEIKWWERGKRRTEYAERAMQIWDNVNPEE